MPIRQIKTKPLVEMIDEHTAKSIENTGRAPQLAVIQSSFTPATESYLSVKRKAAEQFGFDYHVYKVKTCDEFNQTLDWLNADKDVTGILVQLPLLYDLKEQETETLKKVSPEKDVENLVENNNLPPVFARALVLTYLFLKQERESQRISFQEEKIFLYASEQLTSAIETELERERVSYKIVDKPENATAIITATGNIESVDANDVPENAIIVDGGIEKNEEGHFVGDVAVPDNPEKLEKNIWISAVPGGVGPVTVSVLYNNLAKLSVGEF